MKEIYNYAFKLVCLYVLVLTVFSIFNFDNEVKNFTQSTNNENNNKMLGSSVLYAEQMNSSSNEETKEPENEVEVKTEVVEVKQEPVQQPEPVKQEQTPVEIPNINIIDTSSYAVLASEVVTVSHYGHDCYGCGDGTAAGYYIGDGRRYYNDGTFGSLRIVAADKKYPLGTVIRLNHNGNVFNAIVLDRGGGIGDHAKYQIDLLESSEARANQLGVLYNVSLEVLRYGY